MNVYVFEEGSCRGCRFGGRYITSVEEIERLVGLEGEEDLIETLVYDGDEYDDEKDSIFSALIQLVVEEQVMTFAEVVKELRSNKYIGVLREECSVGFGVTKELAKEGYLSCEVDMDDDWDE